jgi:hypothetical protein
MSLRINSILWFRHHALNGSDARALEQLYDIGSHYVEKVKNETEHYPGVTNEHEIERISITNSPYKLWCKAEQKGKTCTFQDDSKRPCGFTHYEWCSGENVDPPGECTAFLPNTAHKKRFIHTLNIEKDKIPIYQCRHLSTKLNRTQVFCLFHVDPNFWLHENKVMKPSCYPYFIVSARKDGTPVITLNPVKHCGNEEYVQTNDAWQAVLQTLIYMKGQVKLDKLPLSYIYVNFGKWMQQKADDPTFRHCHAHINIVLTRQTIEKINDINPSKKNERKGKKLFQPLVGSIMPPKTHRFDDALKLIEYMNDHMTPILIKQNRELARSISTLKVEVEMLKQENINMWQLFFGPTHDGQEADDSGHGTDATDGATGISNEILPTELSESTS